MEHRWGKGGKGKFRKSSTVEETLSRKVPYPILFLIITFLFRYDYISLLDIDEVMVPLQHDNWSNMMDAIVNQSIQVCVGKGQW